MTPGLVARVICASAETRSFKRASLALCQIAGSQVSAKTIARIASEVGGELAQLRDAGAHALVQRGAEPPALAVVQCDGGRIRTRQSGQGAGVHGAAWRETKNACLLRMTHQVFSVDPHPELPRAFCDPQKVAQLAEKPPLAGLSSPAEPAPKSTKKSSTWRPKRLLRTCLSSLEKPGPFGIQMRREARQRRFFEARAQAFLGDGLPWNWSIWKRRFPTFTPILDFIHALSYVYQAAIVLRTAPSETWSCYAALATACWQGRVDEVIAALRGWLAEQGLAEVAQLDDDDPRQAVIDAARYLNNNRTRMDYPAYRRAGLPVTSALMESMVKEVNYRVKGTEMFWNDPAGAEAILQIRAAALSEDDRLIRYLAARPGHPYVRRSSSAPAIAA